MMRAKCVLNTQPTSKMPCALRMQVDVWKKNLEFMGKDLIISHLEFIFVENQSLRSEICIMLIIERIY
jgi:hypothetical protein